jgi:alcohol dehydrogenase class IV
MAIISKTVVPDVALVDAETTLTLAPYLTACTGIDALTHAIEAYASTANSPVVDVHALAAIELLWRNIDTAVMSPTDLNARENMLLGSLQAGLAFSNASLGAVHAMRIRWGDIWICHTVNVMPCCSIMLSALTSVPHPNVINVLRLRWACIPKDLMSGSAHH